MDSFWGSWQNLVFVSIILGTMVHFQDSEYHSVQASWKNLSDHAWSAWKALLDIEFLFHSFKFLSVQFSSATQSCPTLCDPMDCSMRGLPRSPSPTPGVYSNSCPSSQWCHPAISSSVVPFSSRPQSLPASGSFPMSQFFASGGQSVGSFTFTISPSNEYSGLISFRMHWLDLLAVQGTLKGLFQHHSSKVSSLRHSAFFIVQLSHPYMTTGKTIALTTQTFVGKVMSLLFNMLSRLVIAFLPRLSDFHFTFIHISNRNSQMLLERQ